jgi:hypothetical protein
VTGAAVSIVVTLVVTLVVGAVISLPLLARFRGTGRAVSFVIARETRECRAGRAVVRAALLDGCGGVVRGVDV